MRGSKFPADMHNYIWCPIYIPSFMIIVSVVSEELWWQDFGTDGQTDGVTRLLDLLSPSATQVITVGKTIHPLYEDLGVKFILKLLELFTCYADSWSSTKMMFMQNTYVNMRLIHVIKQHNYLTYSIIK